MSVLTYRKLDGYKYIVEETYEAAWPELSSEAIECRWYTLRGGQLLVHPGYAWDGASGPTLDTASTMKAALEHDVFYQMLRAGQLPAELREVGDSMLFRRMCEYPAKFSIWAKIRATYFFTAVRLAGGRSAARRETEPQDRIYTV